MRAICGLWRWRHNPLRRATDLAEAWVCLAALLLMLVAAPAVGTLVGSAAESSLQRSVREQHRQRHLVTARVVHELRRATPATDPESLRDTRSLVLASWTAPDGTDRRGAVTARLRDPEPGDRFSLWTDRHGGLAARPLDPATATTHAVLAGIGAGLLAAALLEAVRRLVIWRMVRRRYARWDQAWDRAGPDWGRTGTGS
ncbi:Rv1733c family protein [Streptomyces sp. enrichment culture]|uniref:Rv1733c family protein n=1 Tax=Streptomyces sp. enrichment culture TaxID=1795815 RepID=UPI003F568D50